MNEENRKEAERLFRSLGAKLPWVTNYYKQLCESPRALEAFMKLKDAGCNPGWILALLSFNAPWSMKAIAADHRDRRSDAKDFAKKMLKYAANLRKFESSPKNRASFETLSRPEFQGLPTMMEDYAKSLLGQAQPSRSHRERNISQISTGFLAAYVSTTGKKHYSDIAYIVTAYNAMLGSTKALTPKAVGRQVKGLHKWNPYLFGFPRT